jgi:DNA mismatch repair ATPase MutS
MAFLVDRQTFSDLEIFEGGRENKSIFKLFNRVITHGGKEKLLEMFYHPLSDIDKIKERQDLISYVHSEKISFVINPFLLDFIETYFLLDDKPVRMSHLNAWHKALKYRLQPTNEYYIKQRGIGYMIEFLQNLYSFVKEKSQQNLPDLLEKHFDFIADSICNTEINRIIGTNAKKKIKPVDLERFDYLFRYYEHDRLKKIFQILYQIDAFQSVAETATALGLVFPEISNDKTIEINGLYHPFVRNAVANDVLLNESGNMFFLTGGNMAGKSTFLKAFGTSVYLAHLGFPVPAVSMRTGVFNGLFSTINIADNINKGYSHYYTEVLRVKSVAEEINRTGNLVVIFDELFRGTNVKDAYDASLATISAFAGVKGSVFLVSTHIMEVADRLRELKNIRFGYFHTSIEGKTATYSYQLRSGVTEERLGMLIFENERIVEIINNSGTLTEI